MRLVHGVVVAFLGMMVLVGCSSGPGATASPSQTSNGGVSDPGQALVESKCTMCHTLDRVDAVDYDLAQWQQTIARMKTNGLVITEEEAAQIAEYLAGR